MYVIKKNFPEFYKKKQTPIQFFDEQFESNFDVLKEKLYYANRFKTLRKDQKQPKEDGKIHLFVIFHYPKVKAPKEDKKDGFSFSFLHNFSSFFRKFDLTKELRLQLGQSRSLRQSQKKFKKETFPLSSFYALKDQFKKEKKLKIIRRKHSWHFSKPFLFQEQLKNKTFGFFRKTIFPSFFKCCAC